MALTLAIDMGTSNLKVGLVKHHGEVLVLRSCATKTITNAAGAAEHDPEELKLMLFNLCLQVLTDEYQGQVEYIVCATYQFGLMLMDAQRKPLTGISLLTDIRSQNTFSDFISLYAEENIYQKTGCPLISQYTLPRLFYFSRREPELLKMAKYFSDSKSFLFEWLTGEWITDISTAAATQFFNANTLQWDSKLLSKLDLAPEQFPKIANGTKFMAPLKKELGIKLGLKKKVQVSLGVYDGAALAVGLSGLKSNVGIINLGTTAMLRIPGNSPVLDKNDNKRIQAYALRENLFLNGGALNNASLTLDWLRNNLFEVDLQQETLRQLTKEPPIIALPYLTGERDSKTGPYASGVFFGLKRNHTRIDLARAVLEGAAYSLRYIYEALQENDLQVNEIRMGGGGVNIEAWPHIISDILGIPVKVSATKEAALVGSAMIALTAAGFFKNMDEASNAMLTNGKKIEPDKSNVEIHNQRYLFFKKLRETLGPLFMEHSELRY